MRLVFSASSYKIYLIILKQEKRGRKTVCSIKMCIFRNEKVLSLAYYLFHYKTFLLSFKVLCKWRKIVKQKKKRLEVQVPLSRAKCSIHFWDETGKLYRSVLISIFIGIPTQLIEGIFKDRVFCLAEICLLRIFINRMGIVTIKTTFRPWMSAEG